MTSVHPGRPISASARVTPSPPRRSSRAVGARVICLHVVEPVVRRSGGPRRGGAPDGGRERAAGGFGGARAAEGRGGREFAELDVEDVIAHGEPPPRSSAGGERGVDMIVLSSHGGRASGASSSARPPRPSCATRSAPCWSSNQRTVVSLESEVWSRKKTCFLSYSRLQTPDSRLLLCVYNSSTT